jgi:hypothetical protein
MELKSSNDYGHIGFTIMVCLTPMFGCYAAFDRQRNAMAPQIVDRAFNDAAERRFSSTA